MYWGGGGERVTWLRVQLSDNRILLSRALTCKLGMQTNRYVEDSPYLQELTAARLKGQTYGFSHAFGTQIFGKTKLS